MANSKTVAPERKKIMDIFATVTEYFFYFNFVEYMVVGLFHLVLPIVIYFVQEQLIFIIPVRIPGIDETSSRGQCIHWVFHAIWVGFGVFGLAICDFFYATPIIHSLLIAEIIHDEMDQLNKYLIQPKVNIFAAKGKFRNILMMHREMSM